MYIGPTNGKDRLGKIGMMTDGTTVDDTSKLYY